jgi:iron(II)-dependent oxidoreductase
MSVLELASSRLLTGLASARAESDRLFEILRPEAIFRRPIAERHRVIFYIGHLDGFDSIQICREGLGQESRDPGFDDLFQAGIDPDSANLPVDKESDWPSLDQVRAYVQRCRARVDENLDQASEEVVSMAIEHRLMHLETLAYMFHNFSHDLKIAQQDPEQRQQGINEGNEWCDVPAGEAILGKPNDGLFGWDNEYKEFHVEIPAFRVHRFPVTNGEYLRFVKEGAAAPHFWVRRDGKIFYRGMFGEILLPLDWPVYATQLEAEAYAQWLGKQVMSESQFHRAAYGTPSGESRAYPWRPQGGRQAPSAARGNFDFSRWDPEPVHSTRVGDSAFGVSQLVGNGWEWTSTPFAPFEGFAPRATYPGYSANFFDNEHYVLKGGSPRTAARLLRRSFRNWFRRDYPYTYSKFRCVEN